VVTGNVESFPSLRIFKRRTKIFELFRQPKIGGGVKKGMTKIRAN